MAVLSKAVHGKGKAGPRFTPPCQAQQKQGFAALCAALPGNSNAQNGTVGLGRGYARLGVATARPGKDVRREAIAWHSFAELGQDKRRGGSPFNEPPQHPYHDLSLAAGELVEDADGLGREGVGVG